MSKTEVEVGDDDLEASPSDESSWPEMRKIIRTYLVKLKDLLWSLLIPILPQPVIVRFMPE